MLKDSRRENLVCFRQNEQGVLALNLILLSKSINLEKLKIINFVLSVNKCSDC